LNKGCVLIVLEIKYFCYVNLLDTLMLISWRIKHQQTHHIYVIQVMTLCQNLDFMTTYMVAFVIICAINNYAWLHDYVIDHTCPFYCLVVNVVIVINTILWYLSLWPCWTHDYIYDWTYDCKYSYKHDGL
jgi:hypothetical protein